MKLYQKVLIVIVVLFVFLIVVGAIANYYILTKPNTTSPIVTIAPSTPTPTPAPTITPASYVEVDYQTVGWFYGTNEPPDYSYNYTYLVLNVTITNYGYSQVNVIGSDGFSVVVNSNTYQASFLSPSYLLYNVSNIDKVYNVFRGGYDFFQNTSYYSFYPPLPLPNPSLPDSATLLNTGSINGLVFFQFGSPTVYPQQPQILNEPFTLQYSVTYGNDATLSEPKANVVINQK